MLYRCLSAIALVAFLISTGCTSYANVVTVTPSNMASYGWSEAHGNGGNGFITNGGPCIAEGQPFPIGSGAFYASCAYQGQTQTETPSSVWFGVDQHNGTSLEGIRLDRIGGLSFTTYIPRWPTIFGSAGEFKGPKQPIQLQIAVTKDGINRRLLMFRPWLCDLPGTQTTQGDATLINAGTWQTWDCMVGTWYEPVTAKMYNGIAGVLADMPNATLVPTSTTYNTADPRGWKSVGWDTSTYMTPPGAVTATGTGKAINFEVGARKCIVGGLFGASGGYSWWQESVGFRGYVDDFTIAVNYGTEMEPNMVVTTYDFEPDPDTPAPHVLALSGKSALGNPVWSGALTANNLVLWRVFGRVTAKGTASGHDYFEINDGASTGSLPYPIRVFADGNDVLNGDYVSVLGELRKFIYGPDPKQMILWSAASNITRYNR